MQVIITFHPRDDLDDADDAGLTSRDRVVGACLTTEEADTAVWQDRVLTFTTTRGPTCIIEDFEVDGFCMSDFVSFTFVSNH